MLIHSVQPIIIKNKKSIYQSLKINPLAGTSWLDTAVYPSQQHHYLTAEPLLTSADIAALAAGRASSRPSASYYEQYLQQYGGGGGGSTGSGSSGAGQQQYDTGVQYGTPQYALPYGQHPAAAAYYPPEKRFMVSRKRSQVYYSSAIFNRLYICLVKYPTPYFYHVIPIGETSCI